MYHVVGSDGAVAGPYTAEEIGRWLAEGRIGRASLVSGGSQPQWVPLAEHPDFALLAAGSPAAPAAPAPASAPTASSRRARTRASQPRRAAASSRRRVIAIAAAALAALALLGVAAAALAPLAPSGRYSLAPDVAASWFRGGDGATPRPLPPRRSDVPAVDVTPMPGIRIQAPAGALDRQRTFSAKQLDARAMVSADQTLRAQDMVLVRGYELDAGMAETDHFLAPATISCDLATLGIPKPLWGRVAIGHLGAHDRVDIVASEQQGSRLVFRTSHNGIWTVILLPVLAGASYAWWQKDMKDVPQGDFAWAYWTPKNARFRVMYPVKWTPRDPAAVKVAEDDYLRLLAKHKLSSKDLTNPSTPTYPAVVPQQPDASSLSPKRFGGSLVQGTDPFTETRGMNDQLGSRQERLAQLLADPDYQALEKKVQSEEFLVNAYLPVKVGNTCIALERAYEYLGERKFRRPGVLNFEACTNVFVVDQSMGTDTYGEARNGDLTRPFIVMDGTKVPDTPYLSLTGEPKAAFDETQLTAVHELFHVVQAAYVWRDWNQDLWFSEANATTIEGEAEAWYVKEKRYATTWKRTNRFFTSFFDAMAWHDPLDGRPNQQHGYGEGYFVEFLRDFYFTSAEGKNAFMTSLYNDFSGVRGGAVESLYRVTGGTPESLSKAFYSFSYAHRADLLAAYTGQGPGPKRPMAVINPQHPVYTWRFAEKGEPLSAQILQVNLPKTTAAAQSATDAPVFVLSTNGVEGFGAVTRAQAAKGIGEWEEVRGGSLLNPAVPRQHLMRVETYVKPPAELTDGARSLDHQGPFVFGMFKDTTPPAVDVKEQTVRITWKEGEAAKVRGSDGKRLLIGHYRVTIVTPDGRQTAFSADKPEAELPVAMLDKLVQASQQTSRNRVFKTLHGIGQADMVTLMNIADALSGAGRPKLAVYYQEVAAVPGSPLGPPSAVATFEIGDEARTATDVTGTWTGRVPFSNGELMVLDLQQELGGGFVGTMRFQGEALPIKGTWQPATKGWQIEQRDSNLWMPMFLIAPGYAQKLPADKIYLTAPPALLTRVDKKRPELGWSKQPNDMQWQDFINMLGRDLEQFNKEMDKRSGEKP